MKSFNPNEIKTYARHHKKFRQRTAGRKEKRQWVYEFKKKLQSQKRLEVIAKITWHNPLPGKVKKDASSPREVS